MNPSAVLLGADVGGTRTRVAVAGPDLVIRARAEAAGAPMRLGNAAATVAMILEAARRAAGDTGAALPVDRAVVGAAGAGRSEEQEELRFALHAAGLARRVVVVSDGEIQLTAAFGVSGPGIVVIAGTGTIAWARSHDGREVRCGGYGWQLDDAGGGYWIGRRALAAAAQAHDHRGGSTALLPQVLVALRLGRFDDLVRWAATAAPPEVAGLAPLVLDVARDGDAVARGIVADAARELVALATALITATMTPDGPVPVAVAGGLLQEGSPLRAAFMGALQRADTRVALVEHPAEGVVGALRLAARDPA